MLDFASPSTLKYIHFHTCSIDHALKIAIKTKTKMQTKTLRLGYYYKHVFPPPDSLPPSPYLVFPQVERPVTLKKEGIQTRNRKLSSKSKKKKSRKNPNIGDLELFNISQYCNERFKKK